METKAIMRAFLFCEGNCGKTTIHRLAFLVPGRMEGKAADYARSNGKLTKAQEILPVIDEKPTVVEKLFGCEECGALRRYGLEVSDGETRRIRDCAGEAGQPAGGEDGEEVPRQPELPQEVVEAAAEGVGPGAATGA